MKKVQNGTITAVNGTVVMGLNGSPLLLVQLTGTYSGVSVVIEGSNNGVNYFPLDVAKSGYLSTVYGTIVLATNQSVAYVASVAEFLWIHVRATAYGSGTVKVLMVNTGGQSPIAESAGYNLTNSNVAKNTFTLVAGTGSVDVPVVNGSGILHRVTCNTTPTAALSLCDSATTSSATPVLYTTGTTVPAQGTVVELNVPFANGLTASQASGSAGLTIAYTPV